MKIVQINAVNRYSSTGANTYELHNYLIKHKHESYVFCTNENSEEERIFRIGDAFDHKRHALLSRFTGLQGHFSKSATRDLVGRLKIITPDIVLLGNLHSNYINLDILFRFLSENKIPVVNVLHDCWSFTGHCCHFTKINCEKWIKQCHHCPLLREDNVSFVDRSSKAFLEKKNLYHALKKVGIIGVSDWIKEKAQLSPVFPKHSKFITIYNWIDFETFYPKDKKESRRILNLCADSFYAISVSHIWTEAKGLFSIVALAQAMPNVKFILIGENPKIKNVPQNIIFTGAIYDLNELSTYYSASDVYLNFSKQETFGKVSAEAMACGLPILSSNTTASPEVVGDCGIIVDTTDKDAVLDAFKRIYNKDYVVERNALQDRVKLLFDKEKNLKSYLNFFEELISF